MRIGICAPSTPLWREDSDKVLAIAARDFPEAELVFDEQCFATHGHFAGMDRQRADVFVNMANDPAFDAIWFARGGYGACRIAEDVVARLNDAARAKVYLGYSDAGNMLGVLYRAGIAKVAHGPMPSDVKRMGGGAAVARSLAWLVRRDAAVLAPEARVEKHPLAAFNLMTLAMMAGTPLMPDLAGHVVMVEEVSEYLYAFDRALFHLTAHLAGHGLAGLRLGRVTDVPENDRPFGEEPEEIAKRWCDRHGVAWMGRADIGHDVDNKVVPFGLASNWQGQ